MEFKVLNLAWKIFKGLTFACQRDTGSPPKKNTCRKGPAGADVCFCTAFLPSPSLKSHWLWYLQKGPCHRFSCTSDGPNPPISVSVCPHATQLGNGTQIYQTSRVQDLFLLLEQGREMQGEVCYLLSCFIAVFQVLSTEEG